MMPHGLLWAQRGMLVAPRVHWWKECVPLVRSAFYSTLPCTGKVWHCAPFSSSSSKHLGYPAPNMSSREEHGGTSDSASFHIAVAGSSMEVFGGPGVSQKDLRRAIDSNTFQQWLSNLTSSSGILTAKGDGVKFSLRSVLIQNVDIFGDRVGFIKFKAEVIDPVSGLKLPGIVFARGNSVGILILLECDGEKYTVLTEQARVPVGRTILELPAGMIDDDSGDFVGTAAREVLEETGLKINSSELVNLTSYLDKSTGQRIFPSPGGSDEEITLLLYRGHANRQMIYCLQGRQTGLLGHGESIKVHVVPYNSLWRATGDSKVLAAVTLYEMAKKDDILPPPPNAAELSTF